MSLNCFNNLKTGDLIFRDNIVYKISSVSKKRIISDMYMILSGPYHSKWNYFTNHHMYSGNVLKILKEQKAIDYMAKEK